MNYGIRYLRTLGLALILVTYVSLAIEQMGLANEDTNSTPPSFYVAFGGTDQIGIFDPSTGEIEGTIPFMGSPSQMIVDPARPVVYVVLDSQQIVAFQTKYQLPLGSVTLPTACGSYVTNGSGSKIYASNCGNNTVYIANTKTFSVTGSIQLPSNVGGIAISDYRHRLYATLPTLHSDAIINTDNDQIEKVKYLGFCGINVCSPNVAVVSPDDRYLISLDQKQCVTIAYDLQKGRVVGRTGNGIPHCFISGVNTSANELWLRWRHHNVGASMDPPFGTLAIFQIRGGYLGSAAFDSSGHGFFVGLGYAPGVRNPNVLVSYPSLLQTSPLWSSSSTIIYVP